MKVVGGTSRLAGECHELHRIRAQCGATEKRQGKVEAKNTSMDVVGLSRERVKILKGEERNSLEEEVARAMGRCVDDMMLVAEGRRVMHWEESEEQCAGKGINEETGPREKRSNQDDGEEKGQQDDAGYPEPKWNEIIAKVRERQQNKAMGRTVHVVTRSLSGERQRCACSPVLVDFRVARSGSGGSQGKDRFELPVHIQDSVADLRLRVAVETGIPCREIRMVCSGRVLDDSLLCGDYYGMYALRRVVGVTRSPCKDLQIVARLKLPYDITPFRTHRATTLTVSPLETLESIRERVSNQFNLLGPLDRWGVKVSQGAMETVLEEGQPLCTAIPDLKDNAEITIFDGFRMNQPSLLVEFRVNGLTIQVADPCDLFAGLTLKPRNYLDGHNANAQHQSQQQRQQQEQQQRLQQRRQLRFPGFRRGFLNTQAASNGTSTRETQPQQAKQSSVSSHSSQALEAQVNIDKSSSQREEPGYSLRVAKNKIVCCESGCRRLIPLHFECAHKCRCYGVFCSSHLLSHTCKFDYQEHEKKSLRKLMEEEKEQ